MIPIFVTNYHNGVNKGMVEDFHDIGAEVYMPKDNWERIGFYAPNDEHQGIAHLISYDEFMRLPRMAIVIPCNQLIDDFMELYRERGSIDTLVYLTAQSISDFPLHGADYVLTHDINYHHMTSAKHKMIYFCRPRIYLPQTKDLRACYDRMQINLYIHNFRGAGFEPEYADAKRFRELWGKPIPFYGYGNENGELLEKQVQEHMMESAFTLLFKRRETWAQLGNASMILGTPLIMLKKYMNNLLTVYEITEDNTVLGETPEELVEKIRSMSFEQYETLSWQARTMAEMFTAKEPRLKQLEWFFGKM